MQGTNLSPEWFQYWNIPPGEIFESPNQFASPVRLELEKCVRRIDRNKGS
jgi:hypothetical protein